MRLFRVQGRISPIVEITKSVTDPAGRFEFPSLAPPRPDDPLDPLFYMVFADADDRPIGAGGIWNGQGHEGNAIEIRILREKTTLSGIVLGADGHPVAGAAVAQWAINGRPVPGILSATTGPDGRFLITRIPYYDWVHAGASAGRGLTFTVFHPDHPVTDIEARELPRNVSVRMPRGCLVTGTVTDSITGRPASGASCERHESAGVPSTFPRSRTTLVASRWSWMRTAITFSSGPETASATRSPIENVLPVRRSSYRISS